jgi:hypothetical protein
MAYSNLFFELHVRAVLVHSSIVLVQAEDGLDLKTRNINFRFYN